MQFRALVSFGLGLSSWLLANAAFAEEPLLAPTPGADTAPAPAAPPPADLPPAGAKSTTIVAGATATVVAYGLALGTSFLLTNDDFNGAKDLRIPIAGPWMSLGRTGCPPSDSDCSKVPIVIGAILNVLDGVVQVGGLGVIAEGLFLNTSSGARPAKKAEGPHVQAVPFSFEKGGVGLGMIGTF
ncbi:MAG TPA: hypothetical protein VHB79_06825 [Polyangiaceae bacterium]|nr:hypothetical protein [Polyangiaceae bacterium]